VAVPTLAAVALLATACGGGSKGQALMHFKSRPDLSPPAITVLASTAAQAPGDVFLAPKKNAIQKGPMILDSKGRLVWFGPVPEQATDFRVQTYEGKPVLTWWEGPPTAPVLGTGLGHGVIMDTSYHQIARVDASFGPDTADLHEFLLTPEGTALITAYRVVPYDLSSLGGPVHGKVADSLIEEIDVKSGKVLFRWHSIGHIAFSESYADLPPKTGDGSDTPWDYFHINSIEPEPDGNLLVSARNTHGVYEIDKKTGAVLWRLGGKKSTFTMGSGTQFFWQHDARRHADGTITIFDDESSPAKLDHSRAIRLRLDLNAKTATLVSAYSVGVLAPSQGNVQLLSNGDEFVGWGAVPRMTEFSPTGKVVFDATFTDGDDSYRAYRFAWAGTPTTHPSIAVEKGDGSTATVYASWNGATEVARWRVVAGTTAENLDPVGAPVARTGFETELKVETDAPYLAVEALDAHGHVLARSSAVQRGGVAVG